MKIKIKKSEPDNSSKNKITRKEALKKAGKYAAFTAASMIVLLNPTKAEAQGSNPANLPVW